MSAFERLSDDLREVIVSASEYARFRGHEQADTGHFLLAVMDRFPDGVETRVLVSIGLRRKACSNIWGFDKVGSNVDPHGPVGVAPDLMRALDTAYGIAADHGRSTKVILDVLLAIVRDIRDCEAHKALRRAHLERFRVAEALERAYSASTPANA